MTPREDYIAGMREYADLLEANPNLLPFGGSEYFCHHCRSAEEIAALRREIGGRWDKDTDGSDEFFRLTRRVGPHRLAIFIERENVCERVVIGTETVEIPDPDLVADVPLVTVEQDVVRWVCPESLLAEAGQ